MFNSMFSHVHVSTCTRADGEPVVQNGLAVTPSDMARLTALGKPVSTTTLGAEYYDGRKKMDFDCDVDFHRGVDINDMWTAHQESKRKLRKAVDFQSKNVNAS